MTEVREDVVKQLVASEATPAELAAARKAQREMAEAKVAEEAKEQLPELEAQESQIQADIEARQAELKAVRAQIRKCRTSLGENTRSTGFGKGVKATDVVAEALNAIDGPARPRDIINWISSNGKYDGASNALSSTVSQTLKAMCDEGTVVKDESAKTYTVA